MSEEKRLKLDHPVSTAHSFHIVSFKALHPLMLWLLGPSQFLKTSSDIQNGSRWQIFQDALNPDQENLDLANVNLMLELLIQKKKQLEAVRRGLWVISVVCCYFHVLNRRVFEGNIKTLVKNVLASEVIRQNIFILYFQVVSLVLYTTHTHIFLLLHRYQTFNITYQAFNITFRKAQWFTFVKWYFSQCEMVIRPVSTLRESKSVFTSQDFGS